MDWLPMQSNGRICAAFVQRLSGSPVADLSLRT